MIGNLDVEMAVANVRENYFEFPTMEKTDTYLK